ncbi:MAG: hypothetical protein H7Y15_19975 [Pseudonocardia sp.]|nr:hypothetical protein [Pseudonocardia sp.]
MAYVASRALVALAVVAAQTLVPKSYHEYLTVWDAFWYLRVAEYGYPVDIYEKVPGTDFNEIAFFPAFPTLLRDVTTLLGGDVVLASVVLNFFLGFAMVAVMRLLFAQWVPERTAQFGAVLFAFFPGTVLFSFAYAEPLALLAAATCLYFLGREQWALAGVAAAVATASRPNMLPIGLACLVAAVVAIRRDGRWYAAIAPVLAGSGILLFFGYLWLRTGDFFGWLNNENVMWEVERDFGTKLFSDITEGLVALDYASTPTALLRLGGLVVAVAGTIMLFRIRVPLAVHAFSLGVLVMALMHSADIGTRPRFVAAAFPVVLGVAVLISRGGPRARWIAVGASALIFFASAGIYMGGETVP